MSRIYAPIQIGLPREFKDNVEYREYAPRAISRNLVHCFWLLRSREILTHDFHYLVLPDGCIDIIFDIHKPPGSRGALVMSSGITSTTINLGQSFAYAGIRTQPGAWLRLPVKAAGESQEVASLTTGQDAEDIRRQLGLESSANAVQRLEEAALAMRDQGAIAENVFIRQLLKRPLSTVADVVEASGYSRRQVQRLIHQRVGYSPHDLLRILRFQKALSSMKGDEYADQSHFIRDFKRVTGMTPNEFKAAYLF